MDAQVAEVSVTRLEKYLVYLSRTTPSRTIEGDNCPGKGPLLIRYYILNTKYVGIYLHHLLRSDHERSQHDHPWASFVFLLTGGYFEHHPPQECACHPGLRSWHYIRQYNLRYMPGKWQHRLELDRPVWSLVVRFKKRRDWGFWTPAGFVQWDRYMYTDDDC